MQHDTLSMLQTLAQLALHRTSAPPAPCLEPPRPESSDMQAVAGEGHHACLHLISLWRLRNIC